MKRFILVITLIGAHATRALAQAAPPPPAPTYEIAADFFHNVQNFELLKTGGLLGIIVGGRDQADVPKDIPGNPGGFVTWAAHGATVEAAENQKFAESLRAYRPPTPADTAGAAAPVVGVYNESALMLCVDSALPQMRKVLGALLGGNRARQTQGWLHLSDRSGTSIGDLKAGVLPCGASMGALRLAVTRPKLADQLGEQILLLSVFKKIPTLPAATRLQVVEAMWQAFFVDRQSEMAKVWSEYWSYVTVEIFMRKQNELQPVSHFNRDADFSADHSAFATFVNESGLVL